MVGVVLDATGQPVTKAEVLLATPTEAARCAEDGGVSNNHETTTDAAGRFEFPDPGEPFTVLARADAGNVLADFPAGRHARRRCDCNRGRRFTATSMMAAERSEVLRSMYVPWFPASASAISTDRESKNKIGPAPTRTVASYSNDCHRKQSACLRDRTTAPVPR